MISRMHRPLPAEGNDLELLLGLPPSQGPPALAPPPNVPIWSDEKAASFCAVIPPIETFMDVPEEIRREQFFTTARRDDVLVGVVTVIQDSGLVVTVLACDQGPRRDLDGLKLTGFCPLRQLPRYNAHGNVLDAFQMGDKVRVFILDVHPTGRLILSMNSKMPSRYLYGDIKLGIITDDELPLHYKKLQNLDGKSYEAYLEATPQFRNPDGLQVLCARMGIPRSSACSLLGCVNKIRLPKPEMACELRRSQLLTFSMKHVAQGVKYFKDGRNTEALQSYNFAIEVEPTNPDAYVARGALYASVGTYSKAVDDLERSLEIQANHANAKNYLGQTLVAFASDISRKDPGKAHQLLQRALKLNPNNTEAADALKELPVTNVQIGSTLGQTNLRTWSKTPSPSRNARGPVVAIQRPDRSPMHSPMGTGRSGGSGGGGGMGPGGPGYATHMERSRAALEQLVEADRTRRTGKETNRYGGVEQSPCSFYSPGRSQDRRRNADNNRDETTPNPNAGKWNIEAPRTATAEARGRDWSEIVVTHNRTGRSVRCRENDDLDDTGRGRRDDNWKRHYDDNGHDGFGTKRGHLDAAELDARGTRRVFTPPRNAREGEYGSLTVHENENDLPMTSRSLQERVQARLRAIDRRHHVDGGPGVVGPDNAPNGPIKPPLRDPVPAAISDNYHGGESPRGNYQGHWRGGGGGGPPMQFDRRGGGGGSFHRQDYYGGRGGGGPGGGGSGGGFFGRMRGRGGPRWRGGGGQYDDYRGRRGNWQPHRYDDRRRDGPSDAGGSYERRRYRRSRSGADRSSRSSRSRSISRASRRSKSARSRSRSARSSSRSSSSRSSSPIRRRKSVNSKRSKVASPSHAKPVVKPETVVTSQPDTKPIKRIDSDENLAELDQFVAQLRAKRQKQQLEQSLPPENLSTPLHTEDDNTQSSNELAKLKVPPREPLVSTILNSSMDEQEERAMEVEPSRESISGGQSNTHSPIRSRETSPPCGGNEAATAAPPSPTPSSEGEASGFTDPGVAV